MGVEVLGRSSDPDERAPGERGGRSSARALRMTLIATSLGFAAVQLDVSAVNVAIKSIGASLGGRVSDLQSVLTAYTVAFAAFILTAGALADRHGARRLFAGGFLLFTAASVVCGLAPSLAVLVVARAIQGVGAAALVPASLSLLNHNFPDRARRVRAVGLYLAGASMTVAGGPLIGGLLIASLGWRAIFFINVPIAAAGVVCAVRWASETPRASARSLDLPGQVAVVVTLVALVAATIDGGNNGFGRPVILAGFALAAGAGAAFLLVESRSRDPMLPLHLVHVATAIGLLINTCFYGLLFVFSLLLQREQHRSPLLAGLALLPMTVAITAANLVAGRVVERFGPRRTVAAGALLIGCATAGLLGVAASTPYTAMIGQLALFGFGAGLSIPVVVSETLGGAEGSRSGVAAGTLNTARQAGSAIGVALFGSLIATTFVSGLHIVLAISVGLMLVVLLLSPRLAPQLWPEQAAK